MVKAQSPWRAVRVGVAALALCVTGLWCAARAAAPPTLDPSFGMPIPPPDTTPRTADANWIWADQTRDDQTILLTRSFTLYEPIHSATLYVTADDHYQAFLNGHPVAKTPTDVSSYAWKTVQTASVADALVRGVNRISIQAKNDFGAAGVLVRLEVNGQIALLSDGSWRYAEQSSPSANLTSPTTDADAGHPAQVIAPVGGGPWGISPSGWPVPLPIDPYLRELPLFPVHSQAVGDATAVEGLATLGSAQNVHLAIHAEPRTLSASTPAVLLDFGKEIAGRVVVRGEPGGQVRIATGESADEALGKPWLAPLDLTLNGREQVGPATAFRFVKLSFPAGPAVTLNDVHADFIYYPVVYKGSFDCSDPRLTRIWYTGAYTTHLCMQRDIWDAPKRDRLLWSGDLHISGEVINNAFADRFLMEQSLRNLREEAQGGNPDTDLPRKHVSGIAGYSSAWICTLADFHRHMGDYAFLRQQHDALLSLLEYQRGDLDDRNLYANKHKSWDFVDWSPLLDGSDGKEPSGYTPAPAATDLFMVKATREASFLLHEMGDTANAQKYSNWADELQAAARRYLVNASGTYGGLRQVNAMAIYSGVATPQQTRSIYDHVLQGGSPAWDVVASPYYNNYVLFALGQCGENDQAISFIRDCWGGMLDEGATTFWEGYDPSWPKDHPHAHLQADNDTGFLVSLCHGWSCGPTNYLTEHVLGVTPTGGGFKTARIAPHLGDLQWAQGDVPTPMGTLHVRVSRNATGTAIDTNLPAGVTVSVATDSATHVLVDGQDPAALAPLPPETVVLSTAGEHHIALTQ